MTPTYRIAPDWVRRLGPNQVFVFGAPIDEDRQRRLAETSGVAVEVAQATASARGGELVLADFWGNRG